MSFIFVVNCRFNHPKICHKFRAFGLKLHNDKGCEKSDCPFFHPNACRDSLKNIQQRKILRFTSLVYPFKSPVVSCASLMKWLKPFSFIKVFSVLKRNKLLLLLFYSHTGISTARCQPPDGMPIPKFFTWRPSQPITKMTPTKMTLSKDSFCQANASHLLPQICTRYSKLTRAKTHMFKYSKMETM